MSQFFVTPALLIVSGDGGLLLLWENPLTSQIQEQYQVTLASTLPLICPDYSLKNAAPKTSYFCSNICQQLISDSFPSACKQRNMGTYKTSRERYWAHPATCMFSNVRFQQNPEITFSLSRDVPKVLGCVSVLSFSPVLQCYCLAVTEHQILPNGSCTRKARGKCGGFVDGPFF